MLKYYFKLFKHSDVTGRGLVAASCAISLSLAGLMAFVVYDMRNSAYRNAILSNQDILGPLASEISRTLDQLDLSVQTVISGLGRADITAADPEIRQLVLFDSQTMAKTFSRIQVLDEGGHLKLDSWTLQPSRIDLSTLDYFRVHKYTSDVGLFVGSPYINRDGVYSIGISRRLTAPDGAFEGVVVATLKLSYYSQLLQSLTLQGQSSVALMHKSGLLLARLPNVGEVIGRDVSNSEVFHLISDGAASGHFEATATVDEIRRIYTYRSVSKYPLVLTIAGTSAEIYSGWKRQAITIAIVTLLLCGSIIVLSIVAAAELRRRATAEKQLEVLATTDALTGLANRRALDKYLDLEWQRALVEQSTLALLMIDADHFKTYNDQHGHQAGDAALMAIAACLAGSIRSAPQFVARYGGEEFAILMPASLESCAEDLATRIHENLGAMSKLSINGNELPTVSIGIAVLKPRLGMLNSSLLQAADSALYAAKRNGRNRTEIAARVAHMRLKIASGQGKASRYGRGT
jgi:diguanylate cyclase (GGDEF)-like protein